MNKQHRVFGLCTESENMIINKVDTDVRNKVYAFYNFVFLDIKYSFIKTWIFYVILAKVN